MQTDTTVALKLTLLLCAVYFFIYVCIFTLQLRIFKNKDPKIFALHIFDLI